MKTTFFSVKMMCMPIALLFIFLQQPAYAQQSLGSLGDPAEAQKECYGDDILKYIPDIESKSKTVLAEFMTGKSIKLRKRNRLVIKGVKSVDFGWGDLGRECRHLTVVYNVTLERKLRRDASGTAEVHYAFKRGSARPGVTFAFHNPVINSDGYNLSHLTASGEDWWARRTPNSFFIPVNENAAGGVAIFLIPFKN